MSARPDDRHLTPQEIAERYLSPDKKSPVGWLFKGSLVCLVLCIGCFALMTFSIGLLILGTILAMLAFTGLLIALVVKMMVGPSNRELAKDRATLMAGRYRSIQVQDRRVHINGVTVGQGVYIVLHVLEGKNVELWVTDGADVDRIVMILTANMLQAPPPYTAG
jgi:hypothetical protein